MKNTQAIAKLMEIWNTVEAKYIADGLTGESLYQATAATVSKGLGLHNEPSHQTAA